MPPHNHSRHRDGTDKLIKYTIGAFALGSLFGYIFMSTAHVMMDIKADKHFGHEKAMPDTGASRRVLKDPQGGQATQAAQLQSQSTAAAKQAAGGYRFPTSGNTIHTLCTSNGSPYLNFQTRIMYGTYKKVLSLPGGEKMVAFTRILHRGSDDVLVGEVPSWRARPLHPECDTWCEFPVADRANAVQQWIDAATKDPSLIKAPWLLMIETDYVWAKPVAAPAAEDRGQLSQGFPFGYIDPQAPGLEGVMRKMYPAERGPLSDIPCSGPAPVLLRIEEFFKITPDWERLSAHIENDPESKDKLGWVREMYAWSVGAALQGVKFDLTLPAKGGKLIVQPPADAELFSASMYHYTWGTIWKDTAGNKVWEFDKRTYTDQVIELKTPSIPLPPPFVSGLVQQDGLPVTQKLYDTYIHMCGLMNSAIAELSDLRQS